ncbi:transcription factor IWS1 [Sporothrix schenckii 1099-18]|uniref:Transcription factor IWS1 n=1 Tax=Sporothrix schenckii 1099-18 TaxID=1397361 RepID=A0A0F2MJ26_SPOSC|nr:transcription factor IWS1 [Sporothrix schenckii 1099-18]KJR89703.1 transcription factor IWS1 [Sporothrix schenckii 1099-18]
MADEASSPAAAISPKADAGIDDDVAKAAATPEPEASDPAGPGGEEAGDNGDDNDDAPQTVEDAGGASGYDDEDEEQLSDVDEDFEDYDPATAEIEERPVTIDEEAARGLKATKRKRDGTEKPRKPKEGRREKKRRPAADDGDAAPGAGDSDEAAEGSNRARRSRADDGAASAPRRKKSASPEVNEEDLTPEERRKRALNRAIDLAIRNPNKRRRKQDEDDLEKMADEEIAQLKIRMERACMADIDARAEGRPAVNKLQLLPQVLSVLNRNDIQETILDPETNFLQSLKFFLEPLNDGSLPSYTIQRDIFTCLTQLPIEKDALLSSGIGKVVLFYTRSKRAEPAIKRMAERLVGEWSRPILKKTDDFKKRHIETREYDYRAARLAEQKSAMGGAPGSQYTQTLAERPMSRFELDREMQLAPPVVNANRATPVGLPQSYTIAPKSTFDGHRGADYRPIGASSVAAFQRMAQRAKMRNKKK